MKCKQIVALFDSYISGTADVTVQKTVEDHLKTCEACKKQLALYRFYFQDAKIENDFPVPSDLNAKIKYTIHQAKQQKKVPFWQNKRILSTATACAFLFVAGLWGISNYAKLQDAANPVIVETATPVTQKTNESPLATPEVIQHTRQLPEPSVTTQTNVPEIAAIEPLSDQSTQIAAYSGNEEGNFGGGGGAKQNSEDLIANNEEVFTLKRNAVVSEDLTVLAEWKEQILSQFPNEELAENTYLVTVTKLELEELMECSVDADENKTQLILRFVESNQQ